jgi:hypothetical protein
LRSGLKTEWIDSDLPNNTSGWRSEWFYIVDQLPGLPRRTGHKPVKISKWDLALVTVPVVVVAALGLLGLGGYSEGTL